MGSRIAKFGKDFQRHLLGILVQQPEAAALLHQFLEPAFFEGKRNKAAYKFLRQTWKKKKTVPSQALFVEAVADQQLARAIYFSDTSDWKASLDYAADFAQVQAVKIEIDKWAGKVNSSTSADLFKMITDFKAALLTGQSLNHNPGEFFQADLEKHLEEYLDPPEEWEPISTGLAHMDVAMRGGARKGELNVVAGRAKIGKSMMLMNIAYAALTPMVNAKTAFFSLEMPKAQCRQRLHQRIALRNADYIENAPHDFIRIMRQRKQMLTGEMFTKAYPQRTMTASMLEADLDWLIANGFKPDQVIVDYGNIMKTESTSKEDRFQIGHNFTELRRIGQERIMSMWSAAQGNRGSVKRIIFGMDDIGEAFEIPQLVDSMWTINQTTKEELTNKVRLVATAARRFKTGISIDCAVNMDIGIFRTTGFTSKTFLKDEDEGAQALAGYQKNKKKKKTVA